MGVFFDERLQLRTSDGLFPDVACELSAHLGNLAREQADADVPDLMDWIRRLYGAEQATPRRASFAQLERAFHRGEQPPSPPRPTRPTAKGPSPELVAQFAELGLTYLPRVVVPSGLPDRAREVIRYDAQRWARGFGERIRGCRYLATLPEARAYQLVRDQLEQGLRPRLRVALVNGDVGHGLFADEDILPGTLVGTYAGVVTCSPVDRKEDLANAYLFAIPRRRRPGALTSVAERLSIDASRAGNELRFANHSDRDDNLDLSAVFWRGFWAPVFVANQPVLRGDQLLFNYGSDYWSGRERPAPLTAY